MRVVVAAAAASEADEYDVPRGDTAGAMMLLASVRLTVGDRDLLSDSSLRVEPGETVGLVAGPATIHHRQPLPLPHSSW